MFRIGFVGLLLTAYVYFFTDWLKHPVIAIRQAPPRLASAAPNQATYPAVFDLMMKYKLTSVKVVPWQDGKFNKFTQPVWWLASVSNSVPTKAIIYGSAIGGMTPKNKPQPLQPGTKYRLLVESGSLKGEADFLPIVVAGPEAAEVGEFGAPLPPPPTE